MTVLGPCQLYNGDANYKRHVMHIDRSLEWLNFNDFKVCNANGRNLETD